MEEKIEDNLLKLGVEKLTESIERNDDKKILLEDLKGLLERRLA